MKTHRPQLRTSIRGTNVPVDLTTNQDLTPSPLFFIIHGVQNNKSQRQTPKLSKQEVVAVPSFYFFQSTIVNHKSSIPMRSPLHVRSTSQRYRCGARLLASVFLNAPFWGQNDAFKAQNDPFLKIFRYDYSVLAWPDPKGLKSG